MSHVEHTLEPGTFWAWPKIARLNREIIVTEKIDGTNAAVCISPEGEVWAQSRKRVITPEDDNAGFAAWVEENKADLLHLGHGRHFGEWWGRGVQRGYGLDHKRFSLFNVGRWTDVRATNGLVGESGKGCAPVCCRVVPILYQGPFDQGRINGCLTNLSATGSAAAPGFDRPEGIVIYHTAANQLFKVTIDGDEMSKGEAEAIAKKAAPAVRPIVAVGTVRRIAPLTPVDRCEVVAQAVGSETVRRFVPLSADGRP